MGTYLTGIARHLAAQSWQIALVTVAVAMITFVLRRRSAHVRYLLWLIVVAKCLVPPLHVTPLRVLPAVLERTPSPSLPPARNPDPSPIPSPVLPDVLKTLHETLALPVDRGLDSRPSPSVAVLLSPLGRAAAALWVIGAASYLAMNLLRALRGHCWLRKTRKPLPGDVQAESEKLLQAHGVRHLPRIWIVEGVGQPFVWGLPQGSIYVPPSFLSLRSPEHRRDILAHELSHVLRFDAAVNAIQIISQGLFWFHPFVWWANGRIRLEREKCCDETVIARLHTTPKDYSTAIVETLARARESGRSVPSLAVASPLKQIEGRIKTILRPGRRFHARPGLPIVTLVVLAALATVPTTLVLTALAVEPVAPTTPLAEFPRTLNGWSGQDLSIDPVVQQYMRAHFADDFITRRYVNTAVQQSVDLCLVYCSSRPAEILRHNPRVCYPGNGWIWDQTAPAHIATSSNRVLDCVTHRFHLPPAQAHVVVLCLYVMDGKIISEQDLATRVARESLQNPPRYAAMVQVSSVREDSVRSAAGAMADALVDTFALRGPSVTIIGRAKQSAAVSADSGNEAEQSRAAIRTFNSPMTFDVFVRETPLDIPDMDPGEMATGPKWIGRTPSTAPLEIPADWVWWVVPTSPVQDWNLLIQEVSRNGVPGLKLFQATDADVEHLAGLPGLKYLDLISAQVTDAGLAHLRSLTQLQWLSLQGTEVTEASMTYLMGMTDLQILDLSYTRITDSGLARLKGLSSLRCLSLHDDPITDTGLEHLKGLTKLQFLDLLGTRITDAGLAHLAALPDLQALLLGSPGIAGPGLAYLKGMPRLRGLVLAGAGVTDTGLAHLAGMTGLQGLTLAGPQITGAGLAHLQGLTGLRVLELEDTQITDADLDYLRGLTQLQWLNLSSDKITDAGLEQLKSLTALEHLAIRGRQITTAGERRIKRALPNLTTD